MSCRAEPPASERAGSHLYHSRHVYLASLVLWGYCEEEELLAPKEGLGHHPCIAEPNVMDDQSWRPMSHENAHAWEEEYEC